MGVSPNRDPAIQNFLAEHRLPQRFLQLVDGWYGVLAETLAQHHAVAKRPLLVGINGSQGSGKSTLASLLALLLTRVHRLRVINISIDDFYLTRESRRLLADSVHQLLATRGVPGTHDVHLMREVLWRLSQDDGEVLVPRFNKAADDRYPVDRWDRVSAPLDLVLVEGWCFGIPAQPEEALGEPVNELEAREDPSGIWRHYVNRQIREGYEEVYGMMDIWIMLQAPSFDCVYQWRLEQEQKLSDGLRHDCHATQASDQLMSAEQIERFIQHFQRLTEYGLRKLPSSVNYLYRLDSDRQIVSAEQPRPVRL